jgi:predicted phosphodiesterase
MKVAVISDIHGNLHALEAVFADISRYTVDEIWCLGDIVGYGAFPSECVELVRERCSVVLSGNHDLAACKRILIDEFNFEARQAIEWTAERLTHEETSYLKELEPLREVTIGGLSLVLAHGSPLEPIWEYVLSPFELERVFYFLEEKGLKLCLLGHSHVQFFSTSLVVPPELLRSDKELRFDRGELVIINPGSVGQPRDYDPRAAYCLVEIESGRISLQLKRVEYDVEAAATSIIEAGLPVFLAARLRIGY